LQALGFDAAEHLYPALGEGGREVSSIRVHKHKGLFSSSSQVVEGAASGGQWQSGTEGPGPGTISSISEEAGAQPEVLMLLSISTQLLGRKSGPPARKRRKGRIQATSLFNICFTISDQ